MIPGQTAEELFPKAPSCKPITWLRLGAGFAGLCHDLFNKQVTQADASPDPSFLPSSEHLGRMFVKISPQLA